MSLVQDIENLLPQTQCQSCGYSGCRPYAQALVSGQAQINQCPPGGVHTLRALGELMKVHWQPFVADMEKQYRPPAVAKIREEACIGCTKCIQACPVDAIIGTTKKMHQIIPWECTGCGLCVEPCPVDCIDILPLDEEKFDKEKARIRYESRQMRKEKLEREKQTHYLEKSRETLNAQHSKIDYIQEAMMRIHQKKNHHD